MNFSLPSPAIVAEIRARDLAFRCAIGTGLCLVSWGVTGNASLLGVCAFMLAVFVAKPRALRLLDRHVKAPYLRTLGLLFGALLCNSLLAVPPAFLWAHGTPESTACAALIWCVMMLGALFDRTALGNIRLITALPHAAALLVAPTIRFLATGAMLVNLHIVTISGIICVALVAIIWHRHEKNLAALEAALTRARREEAISRLLFDQSALSAVMLDTNGQIIAASDRFSRFLRQPKEAMIGKRYMDYFPNGPSHWHEAIASAMNGQIVRRDRDAVGMRGRRVLYSNWEIRPWKTGDTIEGVIIYAENVTALIEAETHKHKVEQRLGLALDGTRAAVWELDFANKTLEADERLTVLFGCQPSYRLAVSCEPIHPNDREEIRAVIEQARAKPGHYSAEHRILRPDGSVIWCVSTAQSIACAHGRAVRIVFMSIDISERKQIELDFAQAMARAENRLQNRRHLIEALARETGQTLPPPQRPSPHGDENASAFSLHHQRLARLLAEIELRDRALFDSIEALRQARQQAQTASSAKTEFLANVSHELRTPLNAVIGYAEILEEDLAESGLKQSVNDSQRIARAARQLLGLINGILDLSKIEAGRMELSVTCVDIKKLLQDSADILKPAASGRGNTINLIINADIGSIESDALKLRQCMLNLLSNANKFTADGTITVHARRATGPKGPVLAIDVTDTGCGMTPEQLALLFQVFVQVDHDGQRRSQGTGLGLVITQNLARLLGGDIAVRSEINVGTTFSLTVSERVLGYVQARVA